MFFLKRKPVLVKEGSYDGAYRLELNDKVIGYIRGSMHIHKPTDSFFELAWFHVDKEYRKRGYGRRLMQAIVNDLQAYNTENSDNPIMYILVYPSPDDISPKECYQVYEKLGFIFLNDNPDRSKIGEFMRLKLL